MGRAHDTPRVYMSNLEKYKKTLKAGQEKRIQVLIKRGADWRTWVKAVILDVYQDVVKVRYRITIQEEWIRRDVTREEYIRIADLLIWEAGGRDADQCRGKRGKTRKRAEEEKEDG